MRSEGWWLMSSKIVAWCLCSLGVIVIDIIVITIIIITVSDLIGYTFYLFVFVSGC